MGIRGKVIFKKIYFPFNIFALLPLLFIKAIYKYMNLEIKAQI